MARAPALISVGRGSDDDIILLEFYHNTGRVAWGIREGAGFDSRLTGTFTATFLVAQQQRPRCTPAGSCGRCCEACGGP